MYKVCTGFLRKVGGNYVPKQTVVKQLQILAAALVFSFISTPIQGFSQACDLFLLEVSSGTYPSEVSWEIVDSNLEVVAQGGVGAEVVSIDP